MAHPTDDHAIFEERRVQQHGRNGDSRTEYTRDKGRIIHSSAFRKLQSKTQVSDPVEGDFHRTRLTHSLETAQIGEGIVNHLVHSCKDENQSNPHDIKQWIPSKDLICAACYAHDIGHPPFGHSGERALDACYRAYIGTLIDEAAAAERISTTDVEKKMAVDNSKRLRELVIQFGGFEANAQTLRLLTALVPYKLSMSVDEVAAAGGTGVELGVAGTAQIGATAQVTTATVGLNLTRRTLLSILKYPKSYRSYAMKNGEADGRLEAPDHLVKCFYGLEALVVEWLVEPFSSSDKQCFLHADTNGDHGNGDAKQHKLFTFDCSIMDYADEIAYSTHDIEDAVARGFLSRQQLTDHVADFQAALPSGVDFSLEKAGFSDDDINDLFSADESNRKAVIAKLINLFITSLKMQWRKEYEHPLLSTYLSLPQPTQHLLDFLRDVVKKKVIDSIPHKMLESRANMMIHGLFERLIASGAELIPRYDDALKAVQDAISLNKPHTLDGEGADSGTNNGEVFGSEPFDNKGDTLVKLVKKLAAGRVVIDYISSMTDNSLLKTYNMLFTPGYGSSKEELLV